MMVDQSDSVRSDPEEYQLVDVVDAQGNPTNTRAKRSDVHKHGYWHRAIQCWIVSKEIQKGKIHILFQRRSSGKAAWPLFVDASVAGHCKVAEGFEEACVRELTEELKIVIDSSQLVYYGKNVVDNRRGSFINRELQSVFILEYPFIEIEGLRPRQDEVKSLILVEIGDVLSVVNNKSTSASGKHWSVQEDGLLPYDMINLTTKDLIPDQLGLIRDICLYLIN